MKTQTFKIDQAQLYKIRNRALVRSFKLLGLALLFVGGMQYLESKERPLSLLTTIGVIPLLLLPVFIGTNKLKKSYGTLQVVLMKTVLKRKRK